MDGPFLGIEALREGRVRKHELRSKYTAMFPGVYIARDVEPEFAERAEGAWLWSGRKAFFAA